jgi:hypothetical protein
MKRRQSTCPQCGHVFQTCGVYVRGRFFGHWEPCTLPVGHGGDHRVVWPESDGRIGKRRVL